MNERVCGIDPVTRKLIPISAHDVDEQIRKQRELLQRFEEMFLIRVDDDREDLSDDSQFSRTG